MTRKVKIGLVGVGPGSIAQRVHIPSLRRIPEADIVAETRAMVEAAKARDLNLLFCFNRRFAPTYVRLKQLADERGCHTLILEKTRGQTEAIAPQTMEAANKR